MKLTRSQELFMALGKINASIFIEIDALKDYSSEANAAHEFKLKQLRAIRQQILRKALAAARSENAKHFIAGVKFAIRNS